MNYKKEVEKWLNENTPYPGVKTLSWVDTENLVRKFANYLTLLAKPEGECCEKCIKYESILNHPTQITCTNPNCPCHNEKREEKVDLGARNSTGNPEYDQEEKKEIELLPKYKREYYEKKEEGGFVSECGYKEIPSQEEVVEKINQLTKSINTLWGIVRGKGE